jgi:hypothetical protein
MKSGGDFFHAPEEGGMPRFNHSRRLALAAVVLLGLLGWRWLRRESPHATEKTAATTPTVGVSGFSVAGSREIRALGEPVDDVVRDDLPYRIAEITVDKPVVCRGEKTIVRLRAEHDEGKADWLLPAIGGRIGWAVSMVVPGTKAGRYRIPVQLSDPDGSGPGEMAPYVQKGAFVEVKDCDTPASVWILPSQESSVEEDFRFKAAFHSGDPRGDETAASYVWSFGDGSPKAVTKEPVSRHLYPSEEERGPGRRVFTYLVVVDALDGKGKVLATGSTDVWLRNRIEELQRSEHRLQLIVSYHPHPSADSVGNRFIEVTVRNLSVDETARLSSLEYRLVPCESSASTRVENHPVSDVFTGALVAPRGSLAGRLKWAKDAPDDVCNVDVSIRGASEPSALPIEGVFSMRARVDGVGLTAVADPILAAGVKQAMQKLGRSYVTREDLERLVASGELDTSIGNDLIAGKGRQPLSEQQ